jgi:processive 1,2-diacylglycerol beta-glucosyltransferase
MYTHKKQVLIITGNEGGGHVAATKAVINALDSALYDIHTVCPCESVPCDNLYNYFMKRGDFFYASLLVRMQYVAEVLAPVLESSTAIEKAITKHNPDLIISVIPVNNHVTLQIAKRRNIPVLVIPTDLTFNHFFYRIKSPPRSFKVAVPFMDLPDVEKLIREKGFTIDNFVVTGYPLRPEFSAPLETKTEIWHTICAELGVAKKDKVITLMMGAQGSMKHTLEYVKRILAETGRVCCVSHRVHLVVMCGENEQLRHILNEVHTISQIKIHALGRKDGSYIASLLQHTNVFLTKPGGSSVNEALCSEVYTIFEDSSAKHIWWEYDNMQYAVNKGCGSVVDKSAFGSQLKGALRKTERPFIEECPGRKFDVNFVQLVESMLGLQL